MSNKIIKDAMALTLITLVAGAALGAVHGITKEPIARQEALTRAEAYKEVFEDYQESIALYTEGIKYNPEVSVLYYNRACCYALLHENEKALEDIKFSTQLSPSLIEYMKTDDELSDIRQMPEYQAIYNE